MIQWLHLKNCHSHKDTLVEFHSGVNVFVGDTDSGKSALLRGLEKVVWNNFTSKELTSHWGGPLNISIGVDDNVITLNNDKKDSYLLNKISLAAINGKVPDEISSILNMDEINLQSQIDTFFLLNDTSGYVATYLNKIANLSQIDSTTKSIKSELNETKRNIEHDKKSLKDKEKELKSYSFLAELDVKIKEVNILSKDKLNIQLEIDSILYLLTELSTINAKLEANKKLIKLKPIVDATLKTIESKKSLDFKQENLGFYIVRLEHIASKINKLNKIARLKSLVDSVIKDKEKESILSTKLKTLTNLIDKVSTIEEKIKKSNANRIKERNRYDSEMKKLDKCFFCGAKMN